VTSLEDLGFSRFFSAQFEQFRRSSLVPARIAAQHRGGYQLVGCQAATGDLSGRLRHDLEGIARPAVGDWVVVADDPERAVIHHLLARKTVMTRRAADSETASQIIAANVDLYGIVTSANRDLNPRRIERYLTAVWDSGAQPVVVLNKVDLIEHVQLDELTDALAAVAMGVPIIPASAIAGTGLDALRSCLQPGVTIAFIGSSGVGKSSLINRLLAGAVQHVAAIREDDARGRHTTTRRELLVLPEGGVLVDTPGMRGLGLIEDGGGLDVVFADIVDLAQACRFNDCNHQTEPGCAVQEALLSGALAPDRFASYRKVQREIAAAAARQDPVLAANRKRQWKAISKSMRSFSKTGAKEDW
jgi:ribosome biogenesis GTPase